MFLPPPKGGGFPHLTKFMKPIKKFSTALSILVIISILISYLYTGCFSLFGIKLLYVATCSMEPKIKQGSLVIARVLDDDEALEEGLIYTYIRKDLGYTVTHRLFEIKDDIYIFKGDNNTSTDALPVSRKDILYKILN